MGPLFFCMNAGFYYIDSIEIFFFLACHYIRELGLPCHKVVTCTSNMPNQYNAVENLNAR